MFLEERVEQLERLTAEQGQQTEIVANGLAVLTVEVRGIRQDMTNGFEEVNQRFEQIDRQFEQINQRFEQIDRQFEQVNQRFEQIDRQFEQVRQEFTKVNQRLDEMSTTQQLILTILMDRQK